MPSLQRLEQRTQAVPIRLLISLLGTVSRAALSFLNATLVARGLGAGGYGNLSFLLASFSGLGVLWDAGVSQAFFTGIAGRRRGPRIFFLYSAWLAVQFSLTVPCIAVIFPGRWMHAVWLGQERPVILLAFLASFLTSQGWNTVQVLGEAVRKTSTVQLATVLRAAAHTLLLLLAIPFVRLSVSIVFGFLILEYVVGMAVVAPRFLKANIDREGADVDWKTLVHEFAAYCTPMVGYAILSFGYKFVDQWLLQRYGGSIQQGYFAFAQQFVNVALLATAAIINVLFKELSEASKRGDHERVARLHRRFSISLYAFTAWLIALLLPCSRTILQHTAGPQFTAGAMVFAVMLTFPLHQCLGQINGTFFYATGNTRTLAWLGPIGMGLSIVGGYFTLAPRNAWLPGLGLGATALAVKMVVVQVVAVNLQLWLIARHQKRHYRGFFQLMFFPLLGLSWLAQHALAGTTIPQIVQQGLAGLLYTSVTVALIFRFPLWVGLSPETMRTMWVWCLKHGWPTKASAL